MVFRISTQSFYFVFFFSAPRSSFIKIPYRTRGARGARSGARGPRQSAHSVIYGSNVFV